MKKLLLALMAFSLAIVACEEIENEVPQLMVDFTISANPVYAGEEVVFTANVSGGVAPYTYEWSVGEDVKLSGETATWTPEINNTYKVVLKATDSKGTAVERTKNLVVEPAPVVATGEVKLLWTAKLAGYTSMSSPAIADDGSIYTVTRDSRKLYKISKDGTILWEKPILVNPQDGSQVLGTPSIDTDGTIYICGGTKNKDAVLVAFNPDGSEKWRFSNDKFWNKGNAPEASINGVIAGIGDNNIYIGNTGGAGTVMAVSKADGTRVNYMMDASGGGPAGGVRAGVVLTKNGYACWSGGAYGVFGASAAVLDTAGEGSPWAWRSCYSKDSGWPDGNNSATLAVVDIDGKPAVVGMQSIKADGDTPAYTKVYAIDVATGEELANVKIDECAKQDQGGIAITEDGLAIATLKYNMGKDDGGIALVNLSTKEMVSHYRIGENVTGAPAIDDKGNIHFATEKGNYYVVKANGANFETLVKKDLAELVGNDSRYQEAFACLLVQEDGERISWAKVWSGIVIGDDGTILIQFTDNEDRTVGGLAALSLDYTEGPSKVSPWPMVGQNRKHTNRQK